MIKIKKWLENKKFTILRYVDITIYSFTAWFIFYCIVKHPTITKTISWWKEIYHLLPNEVTFSILLLSGLLTKHILINCRDSVPINPSPKFVGVSSKIAFLSLLERSVIRRIVNPPLSLSISLSFATWISFYGYDVIIDNFYPYCIAYLIGFILPKIYVNKEPHIYQAYQCDHGNPTSRIQEDKPLINKQDDTLNRGVIIERLSTILSTDDANDARGIAIIGPFGIGKSSLINMSVNDALEKNERTVICRLDAWGSYESDEQIQRYIIDEITNTIGELTSVTHLIGLPSKYINSLKGAQSFWLDTLPLLHNHASASSQLKKVDNLLSLMHYQMILIIEDIDRNNHADDILNGIAPLIDKLNHQRNIKLIISIGEKLNNPDIINRVCRYKEFLNYNHMDAHDQILNALRELSSFREFFYKGEIEDFFIKKESEHTLARNALLSYIASQRDLHLILREVSFSWKKFLAGQCDLLDLLAVTILKHYEPNLIALIDEYDNSSKNVENLTKYLSDRNLQNINNSKMVFEYFFTNKFFIPNRLQACCLYKDYYFTMLVERKAKFKNYDNPEDHYFQCAFEIYSGLIDIKEVDATKKIKDMYNSMLEIKEHTKIFYDLEALYGKGTTSLLTLILVHWDAKENSSKQFNIATFRDRLKHVDLFTIKNHPLSLSLTKAISELLSTQNFSTFLSFYKAIKHSNNIDYIYKPPMEKIYSIAKNEYENSSSKYLVDALFSVSQLFFILWKDNLLTLAKLLNDRNDEFERDACDFLYKNQRGTLQGDVYVTLCSIREHLISLNEEHKND
ncbi:P-loop NTPase fold protein [Aeromonas caviae]